MKRFQTTAAKFGETLASVYLMKTELGLLGTLLGLLAWFPLLDCMVRAGSLVGVFCVFLAGTALAAALFAAENMVD